MRIGALSVAMATSDVAFMRAEFISPKERGPPHNDEGGPLGREGRRSTASPIKCATHSKPWFFTISRMR